MSVIVNAIKELEGQRARIDAALRVLHSLDAGKAGGRSTGTRNISAEGRERIAEAQKKRWAKVRRAKKAGAHGKSPRKKAASTEAAAPASE